MSITAAVVTESVPPTKPVMRVFALVRMDEPNVAGLAWIPKTTANIAVAAEKSVRRNKSVTRVSALVQADAPNVVGLVSIRRTIRQTVGHAVTHARKNSSAKKEPASVVMVRLCVVDFVWISKSTWHIAESAAVPVSQGTFATLVFAQTVVV
jgi:hypothetical protein